MKAVLLRVGIDKGYGALSPVFNDNTFEYIPIFYKNKKAIEQNETRTYKDLIGIKGKSVDEYLPKNIRDKKVHLDPEFMTFTYGEVSNPKRNALLKLEKGDFLVFYMGGYFVNKPEEKHCFIFGYFEVEKVYDWNNSNAEQRKNISNTCKNNAHIISSKSKYNLVIVKGSNKSKLLQKCIHITNISSKKGIPYLTKPEITEKYGIREFIVRATPIWITEDNHITNLKSLINNKPK